jgi:xanthine dehydrogenase accessory factor
VSFVASARKAQVLKDSLLTAGADPEAVAGIVAPAGYPISASTPEEIALSVLAAVVANRRRSAASPVALAAEAAGVALPSLAALPARSPCCGGA